ncbi:MAG: RICIN domain-containing protein [Chloroflexota bacterium]
MPKRDVRNESIIPGGPTYRKVIQSFFAKYVFPQELKYKGTGVSRDNVIVEKVVRDGNSWWITCRARYSGTILGVGVADRARVHYKNGHIKVDIGGLKGVINTDGIMPWVNKKLNKRSNHTNNRSITYYYIRQKVNGRFLDAYETSGGDYRATTRPEQRNSSQQWRLTKKGNGSYSIQQRVNGRFLDAYETRGSDFQVTTRPNQGNSSQQWRLTKVGNNLFTIQHGVNGRFLDAYETGGDDYRVTTRLEQNNSSQQWYLAKV